MDAKFLRFGAIEIDGQQYDYDLVIDAGTISKRRKKPSREFKQQFGHTPLSAGEVLPLDGTQLIIGTGAYGRLPIMDGVYAAAQQCSVEIVAVKTPEACELISTLPDDKINAILHLTC